MEGFLPDKRWLLAPWTCDNTKDNINKPHQKVIWLYPFGARSANNWRATRKSEVSVTENVTAPVYRSFHTPFKSLYRHHLIEGFCPGTLLWIGARLCTLANKVSRPKASGITPDMDQHQPLSNQDGQLDHFSSTSYFNDPTISHLLQY